MARHELHAHRVVPNVGVALGRPGSSQVPGRQSVHAISGRPRLAVIFKFDLKRNHDFLCRLDSDSDVLFSQNVFRLSTDG